MRIVGYSWWAGEVYVSLHWKTNVSGCRPVDSLVEWHVTRPFQLRGESCTTTVSCSLCVSHQHSCPRKLLPLVIPHVPRPGCEQASCNKHFKRMGCSKMTLGPEAAIR